MLAGMFASRGGSSPPGASLYDLILENAPYWYCRLNDASGTVAVGEVNERDGFYEASGISYSQPALYPGGPPCVLITGAASSVNIAPANLPVAYDVCSFVCVYRPNVVNSSYRIISTHGNGTTQSWQMRLTNSSSGQLQWVKVTGGIATYNTGFNLVAGVEYLVGFDVAVDGASRRLTIFINGVAVFTQLFAIADFGATSSQGIGLGGCYNAAFALGADNCLSEAAFFDHAIGAARHLAYAEAAGFA